MEGLFFCLASGTVQGFYFSLLQYRLLQVFTARFVPLMQLYSTRRKTAHRALQGLFMRFAPFYYRRCQTDTIDYNATCATLERITAPGRHPARTRYQRHAGRCTGQHRRPIIIRHIRWCSIPQTMQARRGQLLPYADRWQVLRPAHLLMGQRLHLYRVSPAAVSMLPTPGGLQSGTGSLVRAGILAPSTRRSNPAGARRAARNH